MKTLYLLRHAKSSWDDPELKDLLASFECTCVSDVHTNIGSEIDVDVEIDVDTMFPSMLMSKMTES